MAGYRLRHRFSRMEGILTIPSDLFRFGRPIKRNGHPGQETPAVGFPDRIRFIDSVGSENLPENLNVHPDVITAIMCHHYLKPEQRRNAIKACFDLLVPGGLFITFENIYPDSEKHLEIGVQRWKGFQLSQGRSSEDVEQHLGRFNKEYFPIRISEHIELLTVCGFSTAELFWYSQMQAGFYAIK